MIPLEANQPPSGYLSANLRQSRKTDTITPTCPLYPQPYCPEVSAGLEPDAAFQRPYLLSPLVVKITTL
jgi:hypothetical protein